MSGRWPLVGVMLFTCAAVAVVIWNTTPATPKHEAERCMDADMREHVRSILHQSYDAALREHTQLIFRNWMKDASSEQHRRRAGMQHGINAYLDARVATKDWNPPLCPKG